MSKSVRFTKNTYLDSTGVTHQRKPLKDILGKNLGKYAYFVGWYHEVKANYRALVLTNLEIGGSYLISFSFCPIGGSEHYRSCITLLLSITCDYAYDGTGVCVRPRINVLSNHGANYNGSGHVYDVIVQCEGGLAYRALDNWLKEKSVYIFFDKQSDFYNESLQIVRLS